MQPNGPPQMSLVEIGPRFVLTPIRIFEGAFGGATVYSNPGQSTALFVPVRIYSYETRSTEFVSPAAVRSAMRREKGMKYGSRKDAEEKQLSRKEGRKLPEDELAVSKVFA